MTLDKPRINDNSLLDAVALRHDGWRDQLAILFQRYHHQLLRRCYRYLQHRQDAEDATQETELRAWRSIERFRRESSFRTWLFTIADRQCHDLDRKRKSNRISERTRDYLTDHEASRGETSVSDAASEWVTQAITRLPGREREILLLRFFRELAFRDIARHLDIGLSATKMRLYRALDLFADNLAAEQTGNEPGYTLSAPDSTAQIHSAC